MRVYNLLATTRYFCNNCNKAQNGYKKRGFAQSFGHLQCCGSNAVKRPNAFSISSPFYDPKKSHFYEQSEEVIIFHPKLTFALPNFFTEYASVGYMAKRIQMRKNRFLALQKMAEQKKNEAMNANNAAMTDGGPPDHHGIPKQTVSQLKSSLKTL